MIEQIRHSKFSVVILSFCLALAMTGASLIVTMAALAGQTLAENKSLATLPIALQFSATMLTTIPASLLMGRVGRKIGFSIGQNKLFLSNSDGKMIIINLSSGNVTKTVKISGSIISKPFIHNGNLFVIKNGSVNKYN